MAQGSHRTQERVLPGVYAGFISCVCKIQIEVFKNKYRSDRKCLPACGIQAV